MSKTKLHIAFQLRGCAFHAMQGGDVVDQTRLVTWLNALFSCVPDTRRTVLASALLRFCGESEDHEVDSLASNFAILNKQTKQALANGFLEHFKEAVRFYSDLTVSFSWKSVKWIN